MIHDLRGKPVAQSGSKNLIGEPIPQTGDRVRGGVGKAVFEKADGLQPSDLCLDGRYVRVECRPVGKFLPLVFKGFSLGAGRRLLQIGGVFPDLGLQFRDGRAGERLGDSDNDLLSTRDATQRRVSALPRRGESPATRAGECFVVQLHLSQAVRDGSGADGVRG